MFFPAAQGSPLREEIRLMLLRAIDRHIPFVMLSKRPRHISRLLFSPRAVGLVSSFFPVFVRIDGEESFLEEVAR